MNYKVTSKITVNVEVTETGTWAEDITVKQVREQSSSEAMEKLAKVFNGTGSVLHPKGVRVIGQPTVTIVLIKEAE